jgi:hypothetical protein
MYVLYCILKTKRNTHLFVKQINPQIEDELKITTNFNYIEEKKTLHNEIPKIRKKIR